MKYARMYNFEKKIQKFSPQSGPVKMFGGLARMFPRAPLWLSTGLLVHLATNLVQICIYCLNCTIFGPLILRKIIKIAATAYVTF